MKYVLTYIILLACCFACRSNKLVDSSYQEESTFANQSYTAGKDSTAKESSRKDTSGKIGVDNQFCTITEFDSTGRILRILEWGRNTRSAELDVSDRRSSALHVGTKETREKSEGTLNIQEQIQEEVKTDSRPVQGFEWLYIIIPVVIGLLVFLLIKYRKKWLKK